MPPSPTGPPTPNAAHHPPDYGGVTIHGHIVITDGQRLSGATRRPDGAIVVHTIDAPLRRLRFAVADRAVLRGLVLLPAQFGDLMVLLALVSQPTSPPDQPPSENGRAGHGLAGSRRLRLVVAGLFAVLFGLRGQAGTELVLLAAAALGGRVPGLASLLAAAGFAARPVVRNRLVLRPTTDDQAALHGAEHQALACVRAGLALTDANLAAQPVTSPDCETILLGVDQVIFAAVAIGVEGWLPGWPLGMQLVAGLLAWLAAWAVAFELDTRQATRRLRGQQPRWPGPLARLGLRRQARVTTRPSSPAHREVAARALAPLLPADQQALVGPFPSPVAGAPVPAAAEQLR